MSKLRRFCAVLLSAVLVLSIWAAPCVASEETAYTYTVTLYAGNHRTFGGSDTLVFQGLKAGDMVNFEPVLAQIREDESSKYYVMGVRLSGRDNLEESAKETNPSFKVTGDAMYVVAYGIKGEMVAYTVSYVDENGNELYPETTYYGNVGDKPVVAFQYVDGYQPNAYNMAKTLSANAEENVFRFVYTPIAAPVAPSPSPTVNPTAAPAPEDTETPTTPETEGNTENPDEHETTETPANQTAAPENPGTEQETTVPGADQVVQPAQSASPEEGTGETGESNAPEEYIDLDEQQVPLAGPDNDTAAATANGEEQSGIEVGMIALISAVTALVLVGVILLVRRKRKKA